MKKNITKGLMLTAMISLLPTTAWAMLNGGGVQQLPIGVGQGGGYPQLVGNVQLDDNHQRVLDDNVYLSQLFQNDNLSPDQDVLPPQEYIRLLEYRCDCLEKQISEEMIVGNVFQERLRTVRSECDKFKKKRDKSNKECNAIKENYEEFKEKYEKYKKKYEEKVKDYNTRESSKDKMSDGLDNLCKAAGYGGVESADIDDVARNIEYNRRRLMNVRYSWDKVVYSKSNLPQWVVPMSGTNDVDVLRQPGKALRELCDLRRKLKIFDRNKVTDIAIGKLKYGSAELQKLQSDYDNLMCKYNEIKDRNVTLMSQDFRGESALRNEKSESCRLEEENERLHREKITLNERKSSLETEIANLRVKLEAFESVKK
jgi:predicted  nucleic acid-binding Zn-ribbon protein